MDILCLRFVRDPKIHVPILCRIECYISKMDFMIRVKIYRIQLLIESNPNDYDLLDCNAVHFGVSPSTFRRTYDIHLQGQIARQARN